MAASKTFVNSLPEMEKILKEERVGYLGLSLDDVPYVVPLNYGYVAGKILFHCALSGNKLDHIRANPQVCFTVGRQFGDVVPHPQGAVCHVNSDSVICRGIARIIDDVEERRDVLDDFNKCLQPNAERITIGDVSNCSAVEIKINEMTGREERDSKCTYWKYDFDQGIAVHGV
jgi:nitroimidazol reductase NimA-like FMN-containing flavoprotein (pyridoxamine 5'-phosphate oxidase superfamily)